MNIVPYSMIITSNAHAWGASRAYRENTSQEIISVSPTIIQENAWPTQVLTLSTNNSSFCMAAEILRGEPVESLTLCASGKKTATRLAPDGCFPRRPGYAFFAPAAGLPK